MNNKDKNINIIKDKYYNLKKKVEEGDNIIKKTDKSISFNTSQSFEETSGIITDTEYEISAELDDNIDINNEKRSQN